MIHETFKTAEDSSLQSSPERRLWCGVLLLAIQDFKYGIRGVDKYDLRLSISRSWFYSDHCALVCEMAGADHEALKKYILSQDPKTVSANRARRRKRKIAETIH